jgi:hypothetical protein
MEPDHWCGRRPGIKVCCRAINELWGASVFSTVQSIQTLHPDPCGKRRTIRREGDAHAQDILDCPGHLGCVGQHPAVCKKWNLDGHHQRSSCGASHDAMTEHGKKGTDKQCTQMCVMKGAKYVFVNDDKVLMIKNQNFADLKTFAGDRVMVSGDLTGDTITVSKIVAAK